MSSIVTTIILSDFAVFWYIQSCRSSIINSMGVSINLGALMLGFPYEGSSCFVSILGVPDFWKLPCEDGP